MLPPWPISYTGLEETTENVHSFHRLFAVTPILRCPCPVLEPSHKTPSIELFLEFHYHRL